MELKDTIINEMNRLGKNRIPFLFLIDFLAKEPRLIPLSELNSEEIKFEFSGISNVKNSQTEIGSLGSITSFKPISLAEYQLQFDSVQKEIKFGNTYLINLTTESQIELNVELEEIFNLAKARYKVYFKDCFVCFSPETFVQIKDNEITSFPMKGTIDGTIPNAKEIILEDEKEKAEHFTIVDLIRNDLNLVAKKVKVDDFRFVQEIESRNGKILQVSSKISGQLNSDWPSEIGTIFSKLLPAGSISGAPKEKTVDIINKVESHTRGFYTGVAGIFDGNSLDSAVLIRFIEKRNNQYFYKSGGGITFSSDCEKEYKEVIQKIYIPTR